jgi:tryptophanyl-tRNA synthetase
MKTASDAMDSYVQERISVGLFNYPALMAADILLYGAKWVPVGEDQRQHLELTRDLAIRLNNKFGELFTVPAEWDKQLEFNGLDRGVRIRSLRNPEKKMSKSVEDPTGTILLSDNPEEAAKKVMSGTTDSENQINYDWDKQPGIANLLQILNLLSNSDQEATNAQWQGKSSYGELKSAVAESVKGFLTDFQAKLSGVDESSLLQKLEADEKTVSEIAAQTLLKVQKAVGLRPA